MSCEQQEIINQWVASARSSIHGGGLFATRRIPRGTRIIEYVGPRLTKARANRLALERIEQASQSGEGAVYMFSLNKRYDIDGNVPWNPARLINHSCSPNCEPQVIRGHIWIVARRSIAPGAELSFNYGYEAEHWQEHPCRCGAGNCVGAIVARAQWPKLRRLRGAAVGGGRL